MRMSCFFFLPAAGNLESDEPRDCTMQDQGAGELMDTSFGKIAQIAERRSDWSSLSVSAELGTRTTSQRSSSCARGVLKTRDGLGRASEAKNMWSNR